MKGQALSPILLPVCTQRGEERGRADVKLERGEEDIQPMEEHGHAWITPDSCTF